MSRLPLLVFTLWTSLPQLLADAERQLADEAAAQDPDYWKRLRAEERALGYHANANEVAYHDTDAGMWESGE